MNIKGAGLFGSMARASAPAQKSGFSRVKPYSPAGKPQTAKPQQTAGGDKVTISKEAKQAQQASKTQETYARPRAAAKARKASAQDKAASRARKAPAKGLAASRTKKAPAKGNMTQAQMAGGIGRAGGGRPQAQGPRQGGFGGTTIQFSERGGTCYVTKG